MMVELREVNRDNFRECIGLEVRPDQPFVASNLYSLAEAKADPAWTVRAVYADGAMVGFVMYAVEGDELYLCRFMIDRRHQGRGFGRETLGLLESIARASPGVRRFRLSTAPDNQRGIRIYERFGFVDTGELEDGEEVFVKPLD